MAAIQNFRIKQMSPQLRVADLEKAIEFYTQQLGFEIEFRYEDFYAGIIKDGYSIHLKIEEAPAKKAADTEDLDIMFSVENIHKLYEEISSRPVRITQPLRAMPYGNEFYIADPDGNVLAFLETE